MVLDLVEELLRRAFNRESCVGQDDQPVGKGRYGIRIALGHDDGRGAVVA